MSGSTEAIVVWVCIFRCAFLKILTNKGHKLRGVTLDQRSCKVFTGPEHLEKVLCLHKFCTQTAMKKLCFCFMKEPSFNDCIRHKFKCFPKVIYEVHFVGFTECSNEPFSSSEA